MLLDEKIVFSVTPPSKIKERETISLFLYWLGGLVSNLQGLTEKKVFLCFLIISHAIAL